MPGSARERYLSIECTVTVVRVAFSGSLLGRDIRAEPALTSPALPLVAECSNATRV